MRQDGAGVAPALARIHTVARYQEFLPAEVEALVADGLAYRA